MVRHPSSVRPSVNFCANRFFSQTNGRITTKLAHDGLQVSVHPGCAQGQGQGQRSRDTSTFVLARKSLLLATKLAHDGLQVSLHPGCAQGQGQGQRSRDTGTFMSYSVIDGLVIVFRVTWQRQASRKIEQLELLRGLFMSDAITVAQPTLSKYTVQNTVLCKNYHLQTNMFYNMDLSKILSTAI